MKPIDVLVLIVHPHGDLWVSLVEWMQEGPGPRHLLCPTAAKHATTGEPLVLDEVIPVAYRNNEESRRLIAVGTIEDPWASKRAEWALLRGER